MAITDITPIVSESTPKASTTRQPRKPSAPKVNGRRVGFTLPIVAPKASLKQGDLLDVETKDGNVTERKVTVVREIRYGTTTYVVAFADNDIKNMLTAIAALDAQSVKF